MGFPSSTFPGVYATVTDNSFVPASTSLFSAGLLGPANKGPFNTAVLVQSLQGFEATYGTPLANSYLSSAVQVLSTITDGLYVVRVGRQYTVLNTDASGTKTASTFTTHSATAFSANDWVRIRQEGKATTVAQVASTPAPNTTTVTIFTTAPSQALQDNYTAGQVSQSTVAGAASEAEAYLYSYSYTGALPASITIQGTKGQYQFTLVSNNNADLAVARATLVGKTIQLIEGGHVTTQEMQVYAVRNDNTVFCYSSNVSQTGFQAVALQDSYDGAVLNYNVGGVVAVPTVHIYAASAGTWA